MSQSHFSASYYVAVTPSDSVPISFNALYIGTTGNVVLKNTPTGAAITFTAVPVGILWVESSQGFVMSTNTTASNIVALSW